MWSQASPMARPDLAPSGPSHGPVSSYSCESSAAGGSTPPPYAASADPHAPTPPTMTKPLYDLPPAPNNGQCFPIHPEFYDFGTAAHSGAAAAAAVGGQPPPGFSAVSQAEGAYPHGWDGGLVDVELAFPPLAGAVRVEGGDGRQPQVPWDCGVQVYTAMMAMATSPMSQFVPADESMGGRFEALGWPPPTTIGQMALSPRQNSYYASPPPASGDGPRFPRHNSRASLTTSESSMAHAVEQARLDARFRPVAPSQAVVSPGEEDQLKTPPGGTVASNKNNNRLYAGAHDSSPTGPPRRRNARNQTITATTTTDYNAGTLSPAFTPSPEDSTSTTATASIRPSPQAVRRAPDQQQTPKKSGRAEAATKQQPEPAQGRKKQQEQRQKTRSRQAANKCRAKTKLAVADLESTERAMGSEHRELSATARGLRDEVLLLKNELLAHGNCGDPLIQRYLANQARMVGAGVGASSSSP